MRPAAARATVVLAVASTACMADVVAAAQPQAGTYAGATTQPAALPYAGRIRLAAVHDDAGSRIAKVTARMKMDCQGDPARVETYKVDIPAPAGLVSPAGRFRYSVQTTPTTGFTISGRFFSPTRARGTFGRSDAATGCYVGNVKWTAKLR